MRSLEIKNKHTNILASRMIGDSSQEKKNTKAASTVKISNIWLKIIIYVYQGIILQI